MTEAKFALSEVLPFEGVRDDRTDFCFYRKVAFRKPLRGEWYVSGADPMAYRAPSDLLTPYLVVVPTHHAKTVTRYERGQPVRIKR